MTRRELRDETLKVALRAGELLLEAVKLRNECVEYHRRDESAGPPSMSQLEWCGVPPSEMDRFHIGPLTEAMAALGKGGV